MSPPTAMKEVAPGCITGWYHIVLSNLPFRMEWKELKDFLKPALDNDAHIFVEVFNSSTQGWVRVKGRHNFDSAIHYLKVTPVQDRFLFVEAKNATEPVMIKTVVDVSSSGSSGASRKAPRQSSMDSSASASSAASAASWQSASTYTASPRTQQESSGGYATEQYAAPDVNGSGIYPDYFPADSCAPADMNDGYAGYDEYVVPTTPSYNSYAADQYQYPSGGYADYDYADAAGGQSTDYSAYYGEAGEPSQHATYGNHNGYATGYTNGYNNGYTNSHTNGHTNGDAEGEVVQTQYRRIIIKNFSHKCSTKDVKGLIHHVAGREATSIVEIQPATNKSGEFKGHVFVTFGRVSVAKRVRDKLEGLSFQGKSLRACMTTEGVSDGTHKSSSKSKSSKKSSHKDKDKDRDKERDKDKDKDKDKGKGKVKETFEAGPPVVVDGSSKKAAEGSSKSKGKEKDRGQHKVLVDRTRGHQ